MMQGCALNLGKSTYMNEGKLIDVKSHDYHIFIESLILIAFSHLPKRLWKQIRISFFFKEFYYGKFLKSSLETMEENVFIIANKLEKIFPCDLFYVMEHLYFTL